jgi:RNA polymerase sigma-70 factor (ECF subfamily)
MRFRPNGNESHARFDLTVYLDSLYSYAMVLSRNHSNAEDLVQETCLRGLRAMERLDSDSNVKSWLFTILRNIWLNQVRQQRATPETIDLEPDADGSCAPVAKDKDPHAAYVGQIEREQVRAAIEHLPPEFREIILLREYEELPYQDIAALLHCPIGTVMSRLARARAKLRDLLSGCPGNASNSAGAAA